VFDENSSIFQEGKNECIHFPEINEDIDTEAKTAVVWIA